MPLNPQETGGFICDQIVDVKLTPHEAMLQHELDKKK